MNLLNDFTTSVERSLTEIDSNWKTYSGLIVCGTHNPKNVETTIAAIKNARENNIPFLGICMGFQLMLVEWMRHLGFSEANSAEISSNAVPKVIVPLPEIRVGIRPVYWKGKEYQESHWHNFAFARKHKEYFEKDWELSFTDGVLEIAKLKQHSFFLGTQFHPEYQSTKDKPHHILKWFIEKCKNG